MTGADQEVIVRLTRPEDFPGIIALTSAVYPGSPCWSETQLASHVRVFPEGQFTAIRQESDEVVGMAASLIVLWDDYDLRDSWRDFTDGGMFTNHDPEYGRTLYGAEVMVHPGMQGRGIGKMLYAKRRELVRSRGLLRVRAGARLRGYHRYADRMNAEQYVREVVAERIGDPTLTFQLRQGFKVIGVVSNYLRHDPESLGHAAIIEWLNDEVAGPEDYRDQERWMQSG